jgi:AcrR family transcriptional regulator
MATETRILSERQEKTRRRIIDNASKIFLEQGFRNVSVEDLCEVVGVSRVTFYKYFPNRDALVEAIIGEIGSEIIPRVIENFNSDKDFKQILVTHSNLMADFFYSKVSVRMLADIESQMPQTWKRLMRWQRAANEALTEMVERGRREGLVRRDIDPKILTLMFRELTQRFFDPEFLISEDITLARVSSTILNVWLHGIMEPKGNDGDGHAKESLST